MEGWFLQESFAAGSNTLASVLVDLERVVPGLRPLTWKTGGAAYQGIGP